MSYVKIVEIFAMSLYKCVVKYLKWHGQNLVNYKSKEIKYKHIYYYF